MNASRGHKRKISYQDLALTFAKGPLAPQPHNAPPPPMTVAQQQQLHLENLRRNDLARRQSKKPTDHEIPEELADVVVGDGVERYKKLRETEKTLDATVSKKRTDISDNLQRRYTRREGVLRIWISNTAEGQPWQLIEESNALGEDSLGAFEFGEGGQATFRVKIEGKLLDDPLDEKEDEDGEKDEERAKGRPKFSRFFKSITVDFSRSPTMQQDGYNAIEWRKPQSNTPGYDTNSAEVNFDTLEFQRSSDEKINVSISLVRDEKSHERNHERFKLSPELAEILDTEEEDRAGVVQGIWEYCRAMGLQDDEDKRSIVCDEPLRKLFRKDTVYFPYVPDLLMPHLHPLPPIKLDYTIRVDKPYINGTPATEDSPAISPSAPTVYDVWVPLPNPLHHQLTKFHTSKAHLGDLQTIIGTDEQLALLVQKIHQTNAKRKFYENLAKDPANFVQRWTSSQQRDLEVIMAEATRGGGEDAAGEEFRRGGKDGPWGSQLARESVGLWLARSSKTH